MIKIIMIIIINTLFWVFLHFGVAFFIMRIPENIRLRVFNNKKKYFIVSEKEVWFYKKNII
jgi:hypothetical protein